MDRSYLSDWLIWAGIFLIIAIVSGFFGFGLLSGVTYTIAKWLAMIFVILFIIAVIAHTIKKA